MGVEHGAKVSTVGRMGGGVRMTAPDEAAEGRPDLLRARIGLDSDEARAMQTDLVYEAVERDLGRR